jgi:hypothetical protein
VEAAGIEPAAIIGGALFLARPGVSASSPRPDPPPPPALRACESEVDFVPMTPSSQDRLAGALRGAVAERRVPPGLLVAYTDLHGLWGGVSYSVASDGALHVERRQRGGAPWLGACQVAAVRTNPYTVQWSCAGPAPSVCTAPCKR